MFSFMRSARVDGHGLFLLVLPNSLTVEGKIHVAFSPQSPQRARGASGVDGAQEPYLPPRTLLKVPLSLAGLSLLA